MIAFLLKASFVITVLLIFYKVFLEKESFFAINRIYLLGSLILTFALPFVSLPELLSAQGLLSTKIEQINNSAPLHSLPEPTQVSSSSSYAEQYLTTEVKPVNEVGYWLLGIYYFGVIVFFLRFATQILAILWQALNSRDKITDTGYTIVNTSQIKDPCSFFHYIFISPESYDLDTYEQIIAHEKIHVKKLHTLDLIISEIATITLWFNPAVWMFRTEIEKNLEYQTDHLLLDDSTVDKSAYQMSLLKIATSNRPLTATTHYNQSLLKQRIQKMNTKKSSPHSYWKYAFIVPTLLGMLLLINKPLSAIAQQADDEPPLASEEGAEDCGKLLRAVKERDQAKVAELLNTIDPNCAYYTDGEPRSPLVAAARNGDLEIGKLLVEAQGDTEFHATGDETPLMAAAKYGHLDFVKYLVAEGAEISKQLQGDGTALITASQNGHLDVVTYLISQNAEIDQSVPGDGTALINAVRNDHYTTAELLLENGADPYLYAPGDEYAMFHARIAKNKPMIDLLNKYEKED